MQEEPCPHHRRGHVLLSRGSASALQAERHSTHRWRHAGPAPPETRRPHDRLASGLPASSTTEEQTPSVPGHRGCSDGSLGTTSSVAGSLGPREARGASRQGAEPLCWGQTVTARWRRGSPAEQEGREGGHSPRCRCPSPLSPESDGSSREQYELTWLLPKSQECGWLPRCSGSAPPRAGPRSGSSGAPGATWCPCLDPEA